MGKTKYLAAMGLGLFTICLVTRIKGECPPTGCETDPDYCACPETCSGFCPDFPCPTVCPCQPTDFSCCDSCCDCSGDRWCPVAPLSGEGSDLTVVEMNTFCGWGSNGEIAAFSVGSTSCNAGTKVLRWDVGATGRALLGQNMYRMTEDDTNGNHRFEQIGMAEVKWGFS